jgi:hypothetical protein
LAEKVSLIQDENMKRILKWLGIVLGALLGLIVIAMVAFYFKGSAMVSRKYTITPENIPIPTDAASIARGGHFVKAICADCHTDDLSGKKLLDAPFATVYTAT